jgi:hypothetical protein
MHLFAVALTAILFSTAACAQDDPWPRMESPPGAVAYIITPANGEVVSSPITVKFGLQGMGVAPSGVDYPDTGHHHLAINRDVTKFDEPLATESDLIHFGGGQTEASIELEPGEYTLQMFLGDQDHVPHDPPVVSAKVTITVQ